MPSTAGLSVLIRTFNSARTLDQVLRKLAPGRDDEIVVVDSGSTDSTISLAQRYGARIVSVKKPFNYSRSLNVGFTNANSDWVLVLSSHAIPLSDAFIPAVREGLRGLPANVAVAFGPCVLTTRVAQTAASAKTEVFSNREWQCNKKRPGGNTNALYRRALWEQRHFDEQVATAEDLDWFLWAMSAGYAAAQLPALAVLYRNQASLRFMFLKGFQESIIARQMFGSPPLSLAQFCFGVGSYAKKAVSGEIPFSTFLKQSAQQAGVFVGSHRSPPE